jgi:hypothetical protein
MAIAACPLAAGAQELLAPPLTLDADPTPSTSPAALWSAGQDPSFRLPPAPTTPALRLTFYWENDGGFAKPFDRHDRHYTAGVGASLSWRAPWVDDLLKPLPSFGDEFPADQSSFAMGFVGALNIYTPGDISNPAPLFNDRPYAGWSYAGLFFQRANYRAPLPVFESLEVDLGLVGPSSLAQNAQEMVHHEYDYIYPHGWHNQIHDEPEFSIKYEHRWRIFRRGLFMTSEHSGLFADVIPDVGFTAGSLIDELRAGVLFRLALLDDQMPDDFGPGALDRPEDFTFSPASSFRGSFFENVFRHQTVYLFARPYGRLVAHNTLLQGDNWRNDDPVTVNPQPAVGGVQVGIVHRVMNCLEFSYTTTWQSDEFHGQHGGDCWSSIQFSFFLNF